MVKKAIIPAAGYGTRGLPVTKAVPKEMFPIGTKPAIHYIVEEAAASGIEDILIIVSRRKNMIMDYLDHSLELEAFLRQENKTHLLSKLTLPSVRIHYIRQPYANGLGAAIALGQSFVGQEPFAVLLPDDLIFDAKKPGIQQLIDEFYLRGESIVGLQEVEEERLSQYGVIQGSRLDEYTYQIHGIVEKPKVNPPSKAAVMGRYVFTPAIFECLQTITAGVQQEIQLTDAIAALLQKEKGFGRVIEGKRFDIGTEHDYLQVMIHMLNKEMKGRGK